ncbi:hypothetical protein AB0J83_42450 [Actinoplanes sp. NPDC049596]|uniref:NACHT domain-containing protein n=1 Tax=unclassified Actinoplanes TaxID=2626549 RepID=UPI0034338C94
MPSRLSYADAVKILGRAGAFSAATADGGEPAVGLFGAKAEVVRLGGLVAVHIGEAVRGLGRHERSERLQAAHVVLVVAAFFEELDDCLTAAGLAEPEFARDGQVAGEAAGTIVDRLLPAPVPLPAPERPYSTLLKDLHVWFARQSQHLTAPAVGERAGEDPRRAVTHLLDQGLPGGAVARYDEAHRRLAAEIPEFALWADRLETRATTRGLQRLEDLLLRAASGRDPGRQRAALARAYRADLDRPVLGGDAGDVDLPALGAAYLDPRFRVRAAGQGARPADEQWWGEAGVRADFAEFLAAHLTTTQATEAPMLLLGQPGAGKSSLTRILAGRLPAGDFFVCRVALRDVPAEADIQDQVELALRREIGETVSWAELSRDAEGTLPVILLDGFDELLQVTGLHQSDYLQQVARFQQREAALGRPVAVLVTTRVAVADRARLPVGALAVRLEPFDDDQINRWLTVWNSTNARAEPLTADLVLRFRALAEQPLLLLMLALYDATDHALKGGELLDDGRLYERLLTSFAEREVRRVHEGQPDAAIPGLVQQELLRLSVVAFAMFHRLRLWVTEPELDADLAGLGITPSRPGRTEAFRSPLTAGQEMIGRFFFIQRAQAVQDNQTRQTYEFLHATFGEYLVARLVVQAVRDIEAREAASTLALRLGAHNDDDLLRSLLGFTPLTARTTVLPFISALLDTPDRDRLRTWLTGRTAEAVTRPQYAESQYRPIDKRVDHWMATYSYNLMLLTLTCGGELRASDLFIHTDDPAAWLRNSALQWQAAIPSGMWMDAMEVLKVTRGWRDGRRDIALELALDWTRDFPAGADVLWMHGMEPDDDSEVPFAAGVELPPALRSMRLTNHLSDDVLLHALEPLIRRTPSALTQFVAPEPGSYHSVANSLVRMWLAATSTSPANGLASNYIEAASAAMDLAYDNLATASAEVTELVLATMRADAYRLRPDDVCDIVSGLMHNAVVTADAAASAVYCLTTSGAARHSAGADLASRLIEEHTEIEACVLVPALRAIVEGMSHPREEISEVLTYAGRRPELERLAPDLADSLFITPPLALPPIET